MVERQGRAERHLVLRHQPVARRLAAAAASRRDVRVGGRGRLVSRHDASRRHALDLLGQLVRHAGEDRAVRRRRARQALARARRTGVRAGDLERGAACQEPLRFRQRNPPASARRRVSQGALAAVGQDTAPLFSAANWGGQGLHPRGNFEGFVRAASRDKWLEAHGIEHWTHFYTDYGRELQRKFFDFFLKGEDTGWAKQPRVLLQVRHPGRDVRRARGERMADRAHQVDQALFELGRLLAHRNLAHRRSARDLRGARRRRRRS